MHHVIARYKLEPDQVERNLELFRDFHQELESTQPDVVWPVAFQLEDEVSFVHIDVSENHAQIAELATFQRFRSTLAERCEEPPVMTKLHMIGSFRCL